MHEAERSPITVVGLDPGLANLGLGAVREEGKRTRWLGARLVTTRSRSRQTDRLAQIYDEVSEFLALHKPDALAVEGQYFHQQKETAFKVGQALGVVLLAADRNGVEVFEYGPMEVKQALVGSGRASKEQVSYMVRGLLELPADAAARMTSHHVADALALALTHLSARRLKALTLPPR
ncbi:MAG TPA: crossover junction endodeoxyribonuclease RuvC [Trueperaceae bacterium]